MRVGVRRLRAPGAIAVAAAIFFVLATAASAPATQPASYAAAPPAPPAATPAPQVRVNFNSFLHARRKVVGVPRTRVRVRGTVTPFVAGQSVEVRLFRKTKRVLKRTLMIVDAGRGRGRFGLWFKPRRRGVFRASVTVAGVAPAVRAARARARLYVVRPSAGQGSSGTHVRALQSRLARLGYLTPVNGFFGASTARAVLAFNKVAGFRRTTYAGRAAFRRLARGGGAYRVRHPKAGKHAEFDWSRQVLVLARGKRPAIVVHASSGKASTPTVFGKFRFYGRQPGTNSHGMYYSTYFIGGYAIHGYPSVPTYPASHGCIRIPIPSATRVYGWIELGDPIYVYR